MDVKVGVNVNLTAGRSVVTVGACLVDLIGTRASACHGIADKSCTPPDPTADVVILYGKRHRLLALLQY